ncbi:MAG: hypothetical protein IIX54_03355 [Clostridia bacterium]|nr:hypothetical protein [Clostridia bacterium]
MNYELYTLNGKLLLEHIRINMNKAVCPALNFSEEIILSYKERNDSALFYQLKQVLTDEIKDFSKSCFERHYFYVDFANAKPIDEKPFSALFNNGFSVSFHDGYTARYVPFITSQSQSKNFIYSFIREDLFPLLMPRLDLDLDFEKNITNKSLAYLSKLYAYRALYMSSATEVLRYSDELGPKFFNAESIIVLPEKEHNQSDPTCVFTANTTNEVSSGGDAVLKQTETAEKISLTCFDGEGLISPEFSEIIKDKVKGLGSSQSFQIRMPFLKGVLHTVNFHQFLKDKGVCGEKAIVKDAFGIERDLFKAHIIIRPSVFKLAGLLKSLFPTDQERNAFFSAHASDGDRMKYYFEKFALYNHGLYLVKTEASFHNTNYVHLSSQQLSTFDMSCEDLDGIVAEHIAFADGFTTENLADPEKRKELFSVEDKPAWMEILLKDARFLKDPHIKAMVNSHRVSLYNDIALGKLLIRGENRFLSGDLYVFLVDMLERVMYQEDFSKTYEKLKKEDKLLSSGRIYMPGSKASGERVALIRSPHLSRNEDVCTISVTKKDYETYLGHLKGVIITGDTSYIPAALGGADFDGDHISIIYDRRIIDACLKSGYTEINKIKSARPFIHIKEIKLVLPPKKAKIKKYNYICPQVVYTTFTNRIGQISNTAMKIAAVEYDPNIKKPETLPSAAICTILTGNEIDATKKGVRPYIDDVQKFSKKLDEDARYIVKEIEKYIEMKRELENKKGEIPEIVKDENGKLCLGKSSYLPVKEFNPNREHNAVSQLLYRWADAFYNFLENAEKDGFDRNALLEIFGAKPKKSTRCKDIVAAYRSANSTFSDIIDTKKVTEELLAKLTSMITVRLKGQYDNIYSYDSETLSYKDRFEVFQDELLKLTQNMDKAEAVALKEFLYSANAEKFDAEIFWPYNKDKCRGENKLLDDVLALENAELLLNFDFEGYRLLHYALENVIARKTTVDYSKKADKNEFTKKYFSVLEHDIKSRISKAKFQRKLADVALVDLAITENLNLWDEQDFYELIARMYPQYDASLNKAFWLLFTEEEVLNALGGKANA